MSFLSLICLLGSCRHAEQEDGAGGAVPSFLEEFTLDSGKVILRLDKTEMTTAERVKVALEVIYPEKCSLDVTSPDEGLGQFQVVDSMVKGPELDASFMLREVHEYILEPFLPGQYSVPAITSSLKGNEKECSGVTVTTNPVAVQVLSVFPEGGSIGDLSDIIAPLDPPRGFAFLWLLPVLAILGGAAFWYYRSHMQKKKETSEPPVLPHIIAERSLIRLLARELVRKGEIKLFHVELSDILRRYFEARFQFRAPERTTEEFLQDIRNAAVLKPEWKERLALFLTRCDYVKFAKHRPLDAEIDETVEICRKMIYETSAGSRGDAAEQTVSLPSQAPGERAS